MYLETQTATIFKGTLSSEEDRKALADAGFVHVTGLTVHDHRGDKSYIIGEKMTSDQVGKCDHNNGKIVLITTGGEIWLRATTTGDFNKKTRELLVRLCPNGQGAFVPLSNGETVDGHKILTRIIEPYAGLGVEIVS